MDSLPPVSEDQQRRRGMAPPKHQKGTETKLTTLRFSPTTVQGLLYKEAQLLPTQLKMVTEGKLKRYQRKKTTELQHRIFNLLDNYRDNQITPYQLLKKCGKIYGGQYWAFCKFFVDFSCHVPWIKS